MFKYFKSFVATVLFAAAAFSAIGSTASVAQEIKPAPVYNFSDADYTAFERTVVAETFAVDTKVSKTLSGSNTALVVKFTGDVTDECRTYTADFYVPFRTFAKESYSGTFCKGDEHVSVTWLDRVVRG